MADRPLFVSDLLVVALLSVALLALTAAFAIGVHTGATNERERAKPVSVCVDICERSGENLNETEATLYRACVAKKLCPRGTHLPVIGG